MCCSIQWRRGMIRYECFYSVHLQRDEKHHVTQRILARSTLGWKHVLWWTPCRDSGGGLGAQGNCTSAGVGSYSHTNKMLGQASQWATAIFLQSGEDLQYRQSSKGGARLNAFAYPPVSEKKKTWRKFLLNHTRKTQPQSFNPLGKKKNPNSYYWPFSDSLHFLKSYPPELQLPESCGEFLVGILTYIDMSNLSYEAVLKILALVCRFSES